MAVQGQRDNTNKPFIMKGEGIAKSVTFAQDTGRSSKDIERFTVVTRNPSTGKWWAYTDVDAVDGTQWPQGIVMETVDGASLHAGDVEDIAVMKSGPVVCDEEQLVLENSLALSDIINWADDNSDDVQFNSTIEGELRKLGLEFASTVDTTELEA
jgi:hypothetical protein